MYAIRRTWFHTIDSIDLRPPVTLCCACVCAHVHVRVRACVRACVHAYVCGFLKQGDAPDRRREDPYTGRGERDRDDRGRYDDRDRGSYRPADYYDRGFSLDG